MEHKTMSTCFSGKEHQKLVSTVKLLFCGMVSFTSGLRVQYYISYYNIHETIDLNFFLSQITIHFNKYI